jgi:hypothetical protein
MFTSEETAQKLRAVVAHIKENPRQLDMDSWISAEDPDYLNSLPEYKEFLGNYPPCGTERNRHERILPVPG